MQLPRAGTAMPPKLKAVAFAAKLMGANLAHEPPTKPPTAVIFVSVSVNDPTKPKALELFSANVTVDTPPTTIVAGLNALFTAIGDSTVRIAVLLTAPAVGVCVVVTPEVALGRSPSVLLVTEKLSVHEPLAGTVMPLKLNNVAPAESVAGVMPAQEPVTAPPTALIPISVSVNEAFVTLPAVVLLSDRKTVEAPPLRITPGANDLVTVGGTA